MAENENAGVPNQESPQPQQQQQEQKVEQPQQQDGWNDAEYDKLFTRYKKDPKELGKAQWEAQRTITKLTQELAAFKKQAPAPAPAPEAKTVQKVAEQVAKPGSLFSKAYAEVSETGSISQDLIEQLDISPEQLPLLKEVFTEIKGRRDKEAQKVVETPISELKKFAVQEGVYTDQELATIQSNLNHGFYGVLKDIERKYKESQRTTVEHGTISPSTSGDGYAEPEDYYKARNDPRYNWDKQYTKEVEEKYARSNSADWASKMWRSKR